MLRARDSNALLFPACRTTVVAEPPLFFFFFFLIAWYTVTSLAVR
jgi:hypothetical protein